jgi:hypothetical protein
MKEIKLTGKDYKAISDIAQRLFLNNSPNPYEKEGSYLGQCYLKAILSYCESKNWVIKNNKIWVNSEETELKKT